MNHPELQKRLAEFSEEDQEIAEQLFDLRQAPGQRLQNRIEVIPEPSPPKRWLVPRWGWATALILIGILFFITPAAQATWREVEFMIGQIHVTIREVLPASAPIEPTPADVARMSLAEAKESLPYAFGFPAYLPQSLEIDYELSVVKLDIPIIKILWRDRKDGFVELSAHPYHSDRTYTHLVGPESSQTVWVNDQPAVLVQGAWDDTSQNWSHQDRVLTLIWSVDGVEYKLLSFSQAVSRSELLKLAESIQ